MTFLIDTDNFNTPSLTVNYPSNLKIRENLSNNKFFLDLITLLINNSFVTDIYDKQRDFPFKVHTFTHVKSCFHLSGYVKILLIHMFKIRILCTSHIISKNNQLIYDALHRGFPKKFINIYGFYLLKG